MKNKRVCDCGAAADWGEIGSTWICLACREKDVKKYVDSFKGDLWKLERLENELRMLKIDTVAIAELLNRLKEEIGNIKV